MNQLVLHSRMQDTTHPSADNRNESEWNQTVFSFTIHDAFGLLKTETSVLDCTDPQVRHHPACADLESSQRVAWNAMVQIVPLLQTL